MITTESQTGKHARRETFSPLRRRVMDYIQNSRRYQAQHEAPETLSTQPAVIEADRPEMRWVGAGELRKQRDITASVILTGEPPSRPLVEQSEYPLFTAVAIRHLAGRFTSGTFRRDQ